MPGKTKYCTRHAKTSKIVFADLKIERSKMQPVSKKQSSDLRTLSDERLLHPSRHAKGIFPDPLQMSHARHRFWKCYKTLTCCSLFITFWQRARSLAPVTQGTSERPKVVQTYGVCNILTSKCVSRHNGAHFLDISTNSGPALVCFVPFDFEVRFVPQRRALFRNRKFYKSSEAEVFCPFLLRHVLRATTACSASRHNGVQFLISPLASWLRTRSHPTR